MSEGPHRFVARHVHDLIERQQLDGLPDAALLRQFFSGDDRAFAALVRRHGPLVLGACRRILRLAEDAEDACQATFLILARRSKTVRETDSLAGWLHRVAVRAANRLRRDLRRRAAEPLPVDLRAPEPRGDDLVCREIRGAVDIEVGRLPERFRLPLLLCCLQGKTRSEAAAELGWTEGAVRGRLERGRKLLQSRFARKGLTLPATLLGLLVEQVAPAANPPSGVAARLADGLMRSMALARAKVAAWTTAAVLLMGTTIGLGLHHAAVAQPKPIDAPLPAPASAPPVVNAADVEKNLETFTLRISLAPAGEGKLDPKFNLYHVLLYVPNLRLEPPANGPTGQPVEAHARITKEQAKKVLAALREHAFFDDPKGTQPVFLDPMKLSRSGPGIFTPQISNRDRRLGPTAVERTKPHATFALRFQGGEDPTRREVAYPWDPTMLKVLDAIRSAVVGDAALALDKLIAQLEDERKKWAPAPLTEDLKKLQGAWAVDLTDDHMRFGLISGTTAKCIIEGQKIALKAKVQLDPLLDLETFRGTFELLPGSPRRMAIKGTRDTVAREEPGNWTALYEVNDTTLKLLLPPANTAPPDALAAKDGSTRPGDRVFVLKKAVPGVASEWGGAVQNMQARIRTSKSRYAAGEVPLFDLDIRDTHSGIAGKPWHWLAPRVGEFTRVEVDGVWYRFPIIDLTKVSDSKLELGQTVEKWASVAVSGELWGLYGPTKAPPVQFVLTPGKHRVRVGIRFKPSEVGRAEAEAVSGAIDIEVLAATDNLGLESKWGESSEGVRARIRTKKSTFVVGEDLSIEFDVKSDADGRRWHAGQSGQYARVEVDGVWYVYKYQTWEHLVSHELAPGKEVTPWTVVRFGANWVADKAMPVRDLELKPGKHTIRVGYGFWHDSPPTASAQPISNPLEIEVLADASKPAAQGLGR